MENKVLDTVKKYNMLEKNDTVVIGLSGGADSVALLHFLISLREEYNLTLAACHINHLLRGEEADRDENFARKICAENNIDIYVLHSDINKLSAERKIGTEQCGREIRYSFFEDTAKTLNAKIATAHTASDNAETVIFNMTRGCGIKGLCGIPPVRDNIIRPLIEITRSEIEKYCSKNGYEYITDSTNLEREYTRNKIRLDVIPVLKNINPSLENTLARMSIQMRDNYKFIRNCAEKALSDAETGNGYRTDILLSLDDTVLSAAITILAEKCDIVPETRHIELIKNIIYNTGAVNIKKNVSAVSKQGFLRIINCSENCCNDVIDFKEQKIVNINNKKIIISKMNMDKFNKHKKNNKILFNNSIDYDTIPCIRVFRTRRSGDVFTLPKRNITKSLKKYFCEIKMPQEKRDSVIILASDSEVIWIEGIGASEKYRVTESTENVLTFNVVN